MLLEILIIGALMGILGQGARAIIGLKGMADTAQAQGLNPNDLFEAGRLLVSFLIGIVVGLASVLVYLKSGGSATADPSWQIMLAWAVSAYAGTDFLEGFIAQYLAPGTTASTAKKPAAAAVQQPATYPYNDAEKVVMAVLQGGAGVTDKTSLSDLNYVNIENLYILAGQINDALKPKGYEIDNSGVASWSTVGDVVKSVEAAKPIGSQS
jgi:hypothetical protein